MSRRVYFIKPIGMDGPVKIGCSASPERRRNTLETWSPFPLEVVAQIEGGEDIERRFHAKFRPQHRNREWFEHSPELQAVIDAIRAGSFDPETLPPPIRLLKFGDRTKRRWTEEQKAELRHWRAFRKAQSDSGRVLLGNSTYEQRLAFMADPQAHGITLEEFQARIKENVAKSHVERCINVVGLEELRSRILNASVAA